MRTARLEIASHYLVGKVPSQMIQLKNSGANVFFNISTPKFAAQAIRKAAEIGWKPAHYLNNVSASIGAVLKPAGLENAKEIITAAFLKDPRSEEHTSELQSLRHLVC